MKNYRVTFSDHAAKSRKPTLQRREDYAPAEPISPVTQMRSRGVLTEVEAMAGEALRMILIAPDGHADRLQMARECLDCPRTYTLVTAYCHGIGSIESIGRDWAGYRDPAQARAAGVSLIKSGLSRLARGWL
jgi:hypothetical protein